MAVTNIGDGASGRRRSLDAEINLVPFIDLLSMCICFLLMTAVWSQLNSIQVKQSTGTEGLATSKKSLDLEVKFLSSTQVSLVVKNSGKQIRSIQVSGAGAPEFLKSLDTEIRSLQGAVSAQGEIQAVMLTPKAGVDYGSLVSVMDTFRKNKLVNLGVVPVSPTAGI